MDNDNRDGASACPSEAVLRAFGLGDLPSPFFETVAEHVASCPDCEAVLDRLRGTPDRLLARLRRLGDTAPGFAGGDAVRARHADAPGRRK